MNQRAVIFVVADKNMEFMFRGFLERAGAFKSLGCREFEFDAKQDLLVASDHDPGLYSKARNYAQGARRTHARLVIAVDADWQGSPGADKIRQQIESECVLAGWTPDAVCILVLDPEIENWVWQDNPNVETEVGHKGTSLRKQLAEEGAWPEGMAKPPRPKETLEAVLRRNRIPRSSGLYRRVAERVGVKHCTDAAFLRLAEALRTWFPT